MHLVLKRYLYSRDWPRLDKMTFDATGCSAARPVPPVQSPHLSRTPTCPESPPVQTTCPDTSNTMTRTPSSPDWHTLIPRGVVGKISATAQVA
jgi:hypothetical protein